MSSPPTTAGSTSDPPSPATRVPPERSVPARVSADGSRRSATDDRGGSPLSRHDSGARSGDGGDATNGGRGRGARHEESGRGPTSEDDGDNDDSKVDPDSARRGPLSPDEFALISVPLDTWVGRFVRITTPRHNGTTGLVHRTGNGWVNLQTSLGDVAKRAYDLVVIPEERANITGGNAGLEKGDASRGKRYRGSKGGPTSMGSNSGSGDERKVSLRGRNSRSSAPTANSSSDSSGQDDNDDDGDEHENGRSTRRRGRAAMDDGSDFDEADHGDDDDDDGDNDDDRYDDRMRHPARGGRPFPGSKGRAMNKLGGREKGDNRYGGGEPVKSSGRMSITYTRREGGGSKPRGRAGEQDKMRERERARERGDGSKGGAGRDRDGMKGESFVPIGRGKEKDSDAGIPRVKRRDNGNPFGAPADPEDKLPSSATGRERVDRSKDKNGQAATGKKDEAVIKSSWATQMQKAKERPNLVHWRDELVAITKDSSEDFEDATLSVELMRVRCDVCYHEKSDGDKFCWNGDCWMSPVFSGYFKTDADGVRKVEAPTPQRSGYINTFGRETIIDSALTSALQAPVKWLETKRKRKLEAHEIFSEDPALYRWQCWASNYQDPNSKDPTFVEDPRFKADNKRARGSTAGHARHTSASRLSPEGRRHGFRSHDDHFGESERGTKGGIVGISSSHGGGSTGAGEATDVAPSRPGGGVGASGMMDRPSASYKMGRAGDEEPRGRAFGSDGGGRVMEPAAVGGDAMHMDGGGGRPGVPRRSDVGGGRNW